jgi:hypothetical protein
MARESAGSRPITAASLSGRDPGTGPTVGSHRCNLWITSRADTPQPPERVDRDDCSAPPGPGHASRSRDTPKPATSCQHPPLFASISIAAERHSRPWITAAPAGPFHRLAVLGPTSIEYCPLAILTVPLPLPTSLGLEERGGLAPLSFAAAWPCRRRRFHICGREGCTNNWSEDPVRQVRVERVDSALKWPTKPLPPRE